MSYYEQAIKTWNLHGLKIALNNFCLNRFCSCLSLAICSSSTQCVGSSAVQCVKEAGSDDTRPAYSAVCPPRPPGAVAL